MRRKLAHLAIIFLATFAVAQQPAAPVPTAENHGHAAQPAQSPDKIWSDLMDGNKRFVVGRLEPRRGQCSRVADEVTTPESHGAKLLRQPRASGVGL
ncbi:MAG TPA: hypothetical protein VIF64_21775 [Pyrinomonadaceae bacterium]